MKKLLLILTLFSNLSFPQTVQGKIVNYLSQGLEDKYVEVHLTIDGTYLRHSGRTDANGYFSVNYISNVKDKNLLPEGYEVSLNYPQPFNPKTSFNISLPTKAQISIDVFTILGTRVLTIKKKEYPTGLNRLVVELNGFSNGVYIARINIDDKYFITRKMLLLYGSQHANESAIISIPQLKKQFTLIMLDSITVSGDAIKKKSVYYGMPIPNTDYNIGNIQVDSNFVNLILNVKKLMYWKQPNNQLGNAQVSVSGKSAITDANGQATLLVPSGRNTLVITDPRIYKREAVLKLENDSTHTEYVLDTFIFPQSLMDFYNDIFGRIWPGLGYKDARWIKPPIFYVVADTNDATGKARFLQQKAKIDTVLAPAYTTPLYPEGFLKDYKIEVGLNPPAGETPGYYTISWGDVGTDVGLTYNLSDTITGNILYAESIYNNLLDPYTNDYATIHELSSGMSFVGRSNDIPSVWNSQLSYEDINFTATDLRCILFQYSRQPGNKMPDRDNDF
ncbi:MAG: T9SS type A sorting domain-containing protein [Ignavibacteriaceae bacterium]|nr:T9SS type A sorting domain-containing protein [Ignavibacteriaceae bacterium]